MWSGIPNKALQRKLVTTMHLLNACALFLDNNSFSELEFFNISAQFESMSFRLI